MKVLFDDAVFTMPFGGVVTYFSELIKNFPDDCSYDIAAKSVQSLEFQKPPFNYPESEHTFWNFMPWLKVRGKSYLYRWLATALPGLFPSCEYENRRLFKHKLAVGGYDVIHLTNPHKYTFEWEKYAAKKPVVLTVHDLIPDFNPSARVIRMRRSLALKRATAVIAVSENTKKDILKLYDIPAEKITVIYHGHGESLNKGVQTEKFVGMKYVLYVGQRGGYKNFSFFSRVMSEWLRLHKDVHLVCTGSPLGQDECAFFYKTEVMDRVHSAFVKKEELEYLYRNALAFVYPSKYEGFGIPILDAFGFGCPVILSRASCFPEVAGDAALFFDLDNKKELLACLDSVYKDPKLRDDFIAKGRNRVQEFSWGKCAKETVDVYRKAMEMVKV